MNRAELTKSLAKDSITNFKTGNLLWTVKGNPPLIRCYEINGSKDDWSFKEYTEGDPPPSLTCPLSFLKKSQEVNPEWRNKVREFKKRLKETKDHIVSLFRQCQEDEEVFVVIQSTPGYCLDQTDFRIVNVDPIKSAVPFTVVHGRAPNSKLYLVPIDKVKSVEIRKIDPHMVSAKKPY